MSKKGFTLIELMIVISIVGILLAIAIPNFLKFQCVGYGNELEVDKDVVEAICSRCDKCGDLNITPKEALEMIRNGSDPSEFMGFSDQEEQPEVSSVSTVKSPSIPEMNNKCDCGQPPSQPQAQPDESWKD